LDDEKCTGLAYRGDGGEPRTFEQLGGRLNCSNIAFPVLAQSRRRATRSIVGPLPSGQERRAPSPTASFRRRRPSRDQWAAWLSGAERQHQALRADSPRRRPTLARVAFVDDDGGHIELKRIALTREQLEGLQSFPASDKIKDPRYKWFVSRYGNHCWELDAMDPRALRDCVETEIKKLIEPIAWERCETVNKAEQKSIRDFLGKWNAPNPNAWIDEFLEVSLPAGEVKGDAQS
jgi:hypothetical protein